MSLTLRQPFGYSKLDTLVFHGGPFPESINTSGDTCTVNCPSEIRILPNEIVDIKEIRSIRIEFCTNLDLSEIFLMLGNMPNLAKLHFKSCGIKKIPSELWALYKLKVLNFGNETLMYNNEFTTFPPEISYLEQLQELDLHDNRQFKAFPPEIAGLKALTTINLRGFNAIPENLDLIPNLKSLYLVFSGIVPAHIEPLIARENGIKSVTVGEHYFEMFRKLTERYPDFQLGLVTTTMRGNY